MPSGIETTVKPIGQTPCLSQWEWQVRAGSTIATGCCYTRHAAQLVAEEVARVIERFATEVVG